MTESEYRELAAKAMHEDTPGTMAVIIEQERCAASTELISPSRRVDVFVHDDGRVFIHTLFSLDTPHQVNELIAQLNVARAMMKEGV
jgi:uncharacterized protein YbaP (TraB family)